MPQATILAVDDDAMNLAILEELFGDDYQLSTVGNGPEALAVAERTRPDLILLDIMMPGMDGYEVCRRIRSCDTLKHTKVMLVSAKAMVSERLKGYEAGADDYIIKPFDHDELRAKVRVYLKMKSLEEVNEIKTQFLTLFAHETRTPLTQILALADLFGQRGDLASDERQELSKILRTAGTRLRDLLLRGHRLCELRSGRGTFRVRPFDLAGLVRDALAEPGKNDGRCGENLPGSVFPVPVENDEGGVREALDLVIEFVRKRAASEAPVRIELKIEEGCPVLRLRGALGGLRAEEVPDCLEPYRVSDLSHHSGEGLLSLPLAAELIRRLQGEIAAYAVPGGELEIRIRLPREVDPSLWGDGEMEDALKAA